MGRIFLSRQDGGFRADALRVVPKAIVKRGAFANRAVNEIGQVGPVQREEVRRESGAPAQCAAWSMPLGQAFKKAKRSWLLSRPENGDDWRSGGVFGVFNGHGQARVHPLVHELGPFVQAGLCPDADPLPPMVQRGPCFVEQGGVMPDLVRDQAVQGEAAIIKLLMRSH